MFKKITKFATGLLIAASLSSQAQTFVQASSLTGFNTILPQVSDGSIAFSDVNNDGRPDVLITGRDVNVNRIAKLYTNSGTNFIEVSTPFAGVYQSSIAFSDVNSDGFSDVIITGCTNADCNSIIAKLYTNSGTNFREVVGTPFTAVRMGSVAFSDVNGDNFPDLVISGYNSSRVAVSKLYTNSGINFSEVTTTSLVGIYWGAIAFSDVNGDDKPDLFITGTGNIDPIAKLYTNSGTNFTEVIGTTFTGVHWSSVAFADVNSDGKPDLLNMGRFQDGADTKLYTNSGTNFTEVLNTPFVESEFGSITFSDVNGDNKPDVLITGNLNSGEKTAKLYTNSGTNFTEVRGTNFPGVSQSSVAFSDVNNDGKPDLLITGRDASNIQTSKLYLNIAPTQIVSQPTSATVCIGTLQGFAVSATGNNLRYLWSNNATTTSINISVAGTYFVTVTGLSGKVVSNSFSLVANPLTQIVTQPLAFATVCSGISQAYTVSAVGGNLNYVWSNGLSTTNTMITSVGGAYFVTITGICGSSQTSNEASLVVNPNPITAIVAQPLASATVCNGVAQAYTVSATGANLSYVWSNGLSVTNTMSTSVAGNYLVTVSGACGVPQTTNAATLVLTPLTTVQALPATVTVCSGLSVPLLVTASGANLTYAWSNGTNGANTTISTNGTYFVTVTGTCGTAVSNAVALNVSICAPTSLSPSVSTTNFQLFPNPAQNQITVVGNVGIIEIYNYLGTIVYTGKDTTIDVSGFVNGLYFVKSGNAVVKFVKE